MDYIKELRECVGHRPVILVGAAVLAVNPEGKLLLFRRTDNGCWGPPGGMMAPGESLEETARRETLEETGWKLGASRCSESSQGRTCSMNIRTETRSIMSPWPA
jgi:8-oxo-dGTP pyrophosphatase MutT (NUDIX family)